MYFRSVISLTHWGRVTHICVGKLTIIGSDNGLSPGRCQAIIRTNARILLIGTLGTNFSVILSDIHTFSFKKMHLKMSSGRWRPFCLGLNELSSINHNVDMNKFVEIIAKSLWIMHFMTPWNPFQNGSNQSISQVYILTINGSIAPWGCNFVDSKLCSALARRHT